MANELVKESAMRRLENFPTYLVRDVLAASGERPRRVSSKKTMVPRSSHSLTISKTFSLFSMRPGG